MIFICILSYQRPQMLSRLLASLNRAHPDLMRRMDVYVALLEQGSAFPPYEWRMEYTDKAHWHVTSPDNLGVAGGWRKIVDALLPRAVETDIFVFLDDDCYVTHDSWLKTLIAPIVRNEASITGIDAGRLTWDYTYMPCPTNEAPDWVANGRCAVSARVFLRGIAIDTDYFYGYDDVQLCLDAQTAGFRVAAVSCPELVHEPHGVSETAAHFIGQSRLIFMAKNGLHLLGDADDTEPVLRVEGF